MLSNSFNFLNTLFIIRNANSSSVLNRCHLYPMKFKLPKTLRNKYALAVGVFLLWICFFNDIDLFYIIQSRREVSALRTEVKRMKDENVNAQQALYDLSHNKNSLEKFARENYYMKRTNEDVFVFKERSE